MENYKIKFRHIKANEKIFKENNLLNQRHELISKCRHQNKLLLTKFDTND